MSNAAVYERYLRVGPDALGLSETKAALDFRDYNPAEAATVAARLERERREAAERDDLRHAWLREGGDPRDFEAAHREISAEAKKERLSAMDRQAREASARFIVSGF